MGDVPDGLAKADILGWIRIVCKCGLLLFHGKKPHFQTVGCPKCGEIVDLVDNRDKKEQKAD